MLLLFLLFLLLPITVNGVVTSEDCLGCHENYKDVKHGNNTCADCHVDITSLPHKDKLAKPGCKTCHAGAFETYTDSIHRVKGLACKTCHNAHFVDKEKKHCISCHRGAWHTSLPSEQKHMRALGCLACHGKTKESRIEANIKIRKSDTIKREIVDLDGNKFIDRTEWHNLQAYLDKHFKDTYNIEKRYRYKGDVHSVMGKSSDCNACHIKRRLFNSAAININGRFSYEIPADSAIFIPEIPSIQAYKKTEHSKKGVKCADCHVSQKQIDDKTCIKCHKALYGIYKDTSHAKKGAAKCTDCHNPHSIRPYKGLDAKERMAVCTRCHKNYISRHKWLPNTLLHFHYLECSTCHSPQSTKSMVFQFKIKEDGKTRNLAYDDLTGVFEEENDIAKILDRSSDGVISSNELSDFFIELNKKKAVSIGASIMVTKVVHHYSERGSKEKLCSACHSDKAPFYSTMFLILPGKDTYSYLPVKGTILSALPTTMFIDICLIGKERLKKDDFVRMFGMGATQRAEAMNELGFKWVDLIGLGIILLVIIFIVVHIILRVITGR